MIQKTLIVCLAIGSMITAKAQEMTTMNPFFQAYNTPFNVPPFDQIKNEHFKPAILVGIKRNAEEINAIANNPAAPSSSVRASSTGGKGVTRSNQGIMKNHQLIA